MGRNCSWEEYPEKQKEPRYIYLDHDYISVVVYDNKTKDQIMMSHEEWAIKKEEEYDES